MQIVTRRSIENGPLLSSADINEMGKKSPNTSRQITNVHGAIHLQPQSHNTTRESMPSQ